MKEKEKGKGHPFAGHLNPTEEVLWVSSEIQPPVWPTLFGWGSTVVLLFALLVTPAIFGQAPLMKLVELCIGVVGIFGLLAAPVFLVLGIVRFFKKPAHKPGLFYAITDERLLYRSPRDVVSMPLEDLPAMSLSVKEGTKGTLAFNGLFPRWHSLENVHEIKDLIENAHKKRLKELSV